MPTRTKSNPLTTVLCDLPHLQMTIWKATGHQQPIQDRYAISGQTVGSSPTYPPAFPLSSPLSLGVLHPHLRRVHCRKGLPRPVTSLCSRGRATAVGSHGTEPGFHVARNVL